MMTSRLLILALSALWAWNGCSPETNTTPTPVHKGIERENVDAQRFTTIRVDVRTEHIELFLRDDSGRPFNRFDRLTSWLARKNKRLRFAMNAGMYERDYSPVGLLVQDGRQVSPLNLSDGFGNFFKKPNGVFFISDAGPRIVESTEYPALAQGVRLATQSGPLLVHNGVIHPGFSPRAVSRQVRNGVGVSGDTVIFVISEQPVNVNEFAIFFCDRLNCSDALYLDGHVSSLYSPDLHRNDFKTNLGPIVGVVH